MIEVTVWAPTPGVVERGAVGGAGLVPCGACASVVVAQIAEIATQLSGRAGASQVAGAKVGLAQMAGGLLGGDSAVAAVHILVA